MTGDREAQLDKSISNLTKKMPKLQNDIKSIKNKLAKLSGRIESLELMALPDQISNLDDEIKAVNSNLLSVSRFFAVFEMDFMQFHLRSRIQDSEIEYTEDVLEKIIAAFSRAKEAVKYATDPLEIVLDFRNECTRISKEYELDAFT